MNGEKDKKTKMSARLFWDSDELSSEGFFSKPSTYKFSSIEVIVNRLLRDGEILNQRDERGMPLIHRANSSEPKQLMPILNSEKKPMILRQISKKERFEFVKFMVKHGANPDIETDSGNTLLAHMCLNGVIYDELLQYLMKLGIDINKQNMNDLTILHEMCHNTSSTNTFFETVLLLIKNGADPLIKDKRDNIPIDYLCPSKHVEYLEAIEKYQNWMRRKSSMIFLANQGLLTTSVVDGLTVMQEIKSSTNPKLVGTVLSCLSQEEIYRNILSCI
jgi:ankyrin repeat protein